ncbi:cathepsin L-like isoform X3 [Oscarella lobularis]|uniref:cathepsin L-like isoform X3 n=1 Tax=Oscarella lobularis TaxID=121494 RepID=UPI003313D788
MSFVAFSVLCVVAGVFATPGGVNEIDPSDSNVQAAADFAVGEISAQSKTVNPYVRTSISGTQQVVAGLKYELTIKVAESSTCSKTDELSLDLCTVDMTTIHYFRAVVLWQSWMSPDYTLLEFNEVPPSDEEAKFQSFLASYARTYTNDVKQYEMKLMTFQDNLKTIQQLQANEQGTAQYGINEFSDISAQEFLSTHAMANGFPESDVELPMAPKLSTDIPTSVDWREKNVVTPVKNQGSCGSCWAFSVTGNIEGQWAIHKGKLISLSEQELVDCDKVDHGCEGGLPWNAFKQIMALGGLETESDYPYKAADGMCHFEKSKVVVNINGSLNISSDEDQMAAWLASNGPITIGINAAAMQHYHGGIADPWTIFCRPSQIDHGVLIVGYGQDGSKPFWIIKNSWGASWGEKGYYRIIRGKGKCGLNRMPTSATVA